MFDVHPNAGTSEAEVVCSDAHEIDFDLKADLYVVSKATPGGKKYS